MKTIAAMLFTLVLFMLVLAVPADAGCQARGRTYYQQTYAVPYIAPYAPPVYAAVYQPVPVLIPTYAVGYSQDAQEKLNISAALNRIADALGKATPAPPRPEVDPVPQPGAAAPARGGNILVAKCAACHDASVSATKGGRQTLVQDGQMAALDGKILSRVLVNVYTGKMPKGGKLTDEEVAAFVDLIDSLASK